MKLLIIEDEIEAADRLIRLLKDVDKSIEIMEVIESVEDAVDWFQSNNEVDLICMDIHLADGLCFDIFDSVLPKAPIIFTTAYDQYAIKAFKLNSIDYLLKPIEFEELKTAISNYLKKQENIPQPDLNALANLLRPKNYRNRFMGRTGHKDRLLPSDEVAFFQAENKLVYLFDRGQDKYLVSHSLDELESQCDPENFFRINRSELVHIDAIRFIENYFNGRLVITIKNKVQSQLFVSRRRVKEFKEWVSK